MKVFAFIIDLHKERKINADIHLYGFLNNKKESNNRCREEKCIPSFSLETWWDETGR
jgi:hypothetical protein